MGKNKIVRICFLEHLVKNGQFDLMTVINAFKNTIKKNLLMMLNSFYDGSGDKELALKKAAKDLENEYLKNI